MSIATNSATYIAREATRGFQSKVLANGGLISGDSLLYAQTFVTSLTSANIWNKIEDMNIVIGSDFSAGRTKIKNIPSVPSFLSTINTWYPHQYVERGISGGFTNSGIGGADGGGLRTFYFPDTGVNDAHLAAYNRTFPSNAAPWVWSTSAGTRNTAFNLSTANGFSNGGIGVSRAGDGRLGNTGYVCASNNPTLLSCFAGSGHAAGGPYNQPLTGIPANEDVRLWKTADAVGSGIISFYSVGRYLTTGENIVLYNAVQTLQTSLLRNV